jgi:hypothetical protein
LSRSCPSRSSELALAGGFRWLGSSRWQWRLPAYHSLLVMQLRWVWWDSSCNWWWMVAWQCMPWL